MINSTFKVIASLDQIATYTLWMNKPFWDRRVSLKLPVVCFPKQAKLPSGPTLAVASPVLGVTGIQHASKRAFGPWRHAKVTWLVGEGTKRPSKRMNQGVLIGPWCSFRNHPNFFGCIFFGVHPFQYLGVFSGFRGDPLKFQVHHFGNHHGASSQWAGNQFVLIALVPVSISDGDANTADRCPALATGRSIYIYIYIYMDLRFEYLRETGPGTLRQQGADSTSIDYQISTAFYFWFKHFSAVPLAPFHVVVGGQAITCPLVCTFVVWFFAPE